MKSSFLFVALSILLTGAMPTFADSANPPKILSIKLIDKKDSYQSGEIIYFDLEYSGGAPGLRQGQILFQGAYSTMQGSVCLNFSNSVGWDNKASSATGNSDIGLVKPGILRFKAVVQSNCLKGENRLNVRNAIIIDETNLKADTISVAGGWFGKGSPLDFVITVVDGMHIPNGTPVGNAQKSSFTLEFLETNYVVERNSPRILSLPLKSSEGILLSYAVEPNPANACRELPSESFRQSIDVSLDNAGRCLIRVTGRVTRSSFEEIFLTRTVQITSKEALLKAEAEAKAKAESEAKAAAELKAKQEADAKAVAEFKAKQEAEAAAKAEAAKKITITCIKGKTLKKVTAVNSKCPKGYKKK